MTSNRKNSNENCSCGSSSMSGTSFLAGMVLGVAVAGASVLLTTPQSGKETREQIRETLSNLKEKGAELLENIVNLIQIVKETIQTGRDKFVPIVQEIKASVEKWKQEIIPHQDQIKHQLSEIETSLKQLEDVVSDIKN